MFEYICLLAWPSGYSCGLETEGSRLDRICELALRLYSRKGVKELLISKNVVVDFNPIHGNAYTLAEALETLV